MAELKVKVSDNIYQTEIEWVANNVIRKGDTVALEKETLKDVIDNKDLLIDALSRK